METVTKRELNQHTAQVLGRVAESGPVVVTERGRPRWQVSAYQPSSGALDRLERAGRLTAVVADRTPWPSGSSDRSYTSEEFDALLEEMKGDH